jgi:hypothetical protein
MEPPALTARIHLNALDPTDDTQKLNMGYASFETKDGPLTKPVALDTASAVCAITRRDLYDLENRGAMIKALPATQATLIFANGRTEGKFQRVALTFTLSTPHLNRSLVDLEFLVLQAQEPIPIIIGNPTIRDVLGLDLLPVGAPGQPATHLEPDSDPPVPAVSYNLFVMDFSKSPVIQQAFNDNRPLRTGEIIQLRSENDRQVRIAEDAAFKDMIQRVKNQPGVSKRMKELTIAQATRHKNLFHLGPQTNPITIEAKADEFREGFKPEDVPARRFEQSYRKRWNIFQLIAVLVITSVIYAFSSNFERLACNALQVGDEAKPRLVVDTSRQRKMLKQIAYRGKAAEELILLITGPENNRPRCIWSGFDVSSAFHNAMQNRNTPHLARMMQFGGHNYVFNRLIMGGYNSMANLTIILDEAFAGLEGHAHYADDCKNAATSDRELFDRNELFFQRCVKYNIPLNPLKCELVAVSTTWCGYHIDPTGYKPDPRSSEVIHAMQCPKTGEDLAKVIGILRWMASSIPNLSGKLRPMQDVLESVYRKNGNNRTSAVARRELLSNHGWNRTHVHLWNELKKDMANAVTLCHRDLEKQLLLFTDASQTGWSGLLFQANREELSKPIADWDLEPLGCMGGNFNRTQLNWPTVEQEGYAIKRAIERMWHIINDGSTLFIYTDNKDLEAIFHEDSEYIYKRETPGRDRLLRWCTFMNEVPHTIKHIPGEQNIFADVISRLQLPEDKTRLHDDDTGPEPLPSLAGRILTIDMNHALRASTDPDWVQPSIIDIRDYAGDEGNDNPAFKALAAAEQCTFDYNERVWKCSGKILIPDTQIRTKLMVMAHTQGGGHRGVQTTLEHLQSVVYWPGMDRDVKQFCGDCIHCISNMSRIAARPYGRIFHATSRNHVVSMDFLHVGPSEEGNDRVLVLTEQLSGFPLLFPAS